MNIKQQEELFEKILNTLSDYEILILQDAKEQKHKEMFLNFKLEIAPCLLKMRSIHARLKGFQLLLELDPLNPYFQKMVINLNKEIYVH